MRIGVLVSIPMCCSSYNPDPLGRRCRDCYRYVHHHHYRFAYVWGSGPSLPCCQNTIGVVLVDFESIWCCGLPNLMKNRIGRRCFATDSKC